MNRRLLLLLLIAALLVGFWLGRSGFNPPREAGLTPAPPALATVSSLPSLGPQLAASPTPQAAPTGPPAPALRGLPAVERIVDGDTVQLDDGETVRLLGINTPERDQPFYQEARDFTRELLLDELVRVETDVEPRDRYGRLLAYLFLQDGTFANLEIVRNGYAQAWNIPPNSRYETEFARAEAEARAAYRGIWARSTSQLRITGVEADPPGPDDQNLNGETVTIKNTGEQPERLAGYRLSDRSNNTYIFPDRTLRAGATIVVHSGSGRDNAGNLYWGSSRSIWNNSGDTAFLRDAEGNTVDLFSYGEGSD